ncbi:facilitated trehalose transporter Tret1-like [Cimex lectularius]|uniref:Major facilitator superfamily (MFS) profile domain-containing protein n=1 Tax=Cimex lectularius TaxID=79782 RepID=A0A8I6TE59_CIMLE|nr:facilitated trehalose transporter Tret1-like [Cimex lectularius]
MDNITPPAVLKQVWLAMTASLGYLTIGLVRGFSSPAIPSMESNNPELIPHHQALSWISAVPPLGALVGSLFSGAMMQHLGRKRTLIISSPMFAASWLFIAYSTDWLHLVTARALTGLCVGIVLPSAQIYVSECSHPKIRGMVGSFPALFMAGGILMAYILGSFLLWNHLAMVSAAFPIILLFLLIPLPESPTWLRCRGKMKEADQAMSWLHREPFTTNIEMFTVNSPKEAVTSLPKSKKSLALSKAILKGKFSRETLFRGPVLLPFGLVIAIMIFQQISGIDSIIFYTVSIFHISGSTLGEYEATIFVGAVQVVATLLSLFLTDWYGRKVLLLISGSIMAIAMTALGTYFYLYERGRANSFGLLPLLSQLAFITGFSIGFCNIPFILMGELLPIAHRSFLSSIAGACNLGAMFLVIKTYPDITQWLGPEGAFWIYAVLCFTSCIFVHFLLPETKGKSLEEIEAYFESRFKDKKEDPVAQVEQNK